MKFSRCVLNLKSGKLINFFTNRMKYFRKICLRINAGTLICTEIDAVLSGNSARTHTHTYECTHSPSCRSRFLLYWQNFFPIFRGVYFKKEAN